MEPTSQNTKNDTPSIDDIISPDDIELLLNKKKTTRPKMTLYEKARIIGYRAEQIASGVLAFIPVGDLNDPREIAMKELELNKLPYIIKRPMPDGTCEYWRIDELI
jgi:DNA-directed RNA polymerase I, II, and III subunit RPABC2|tara:strand:+ start:2724 stop:3041 length:318 start_codon:yes stop_codon:yes gene_type:complete